MAITIKKKWLYQCLFAICVAVPYLGNYELTFLLWLVAIALTLRRKYSIGIIKCSLCFLAIIAIAFFSTDFSNVNLYFAVRDFTYLLKPVLGFILGYQICSYFFEDAFRTIVKTGFWIAILHLSVLFFAMLVFRITSIHEVRYYAGYFSDFEVYALVILLFKDRFQIQLSRRSYWIMASVLSVSVFMYLARTNFIQLFLLVLGMKGFLVLNRRTLMVMGTLVLLALLGYSAVLYINPRRNGQGMEAFLYKIKIAPTEPFRRKINMQDYIDFNDNYRSVETILTIRETERKGTSALLFGRGLGSVVDLKQKVYLGDMELRYISVLHNSFMTALLKAGLCGVFFLLLSIYFFYNQPRSNIGINREINLLFMGTGIFLIVSYSVLMGFYFTRDCKSILIGLLIAYKEISNRRAMTVRAETENEG